MSKIQHPPEIPDRRIGTTMIARIHQTTRQTASRWCATGLLDTARLDALAGLEAWTAKLGEVLFFTRPELGRQSECRRILHDDSPSLTEDEIRAWVAQMEV